MKLCLDASGKRIGGCLSSVLLSVTSSFALNYDVVYSTTPPVIDGTVDAVWATASPAATGFVEGFTTHIRSYEQTSVSMLWDSSKLYVLFEADDGAIVSAATADDTGFNFSTQDTAEIFLDPSLVQSNGLANDVMYHIVVNPAPGAYTYTEAGQNQPGWDLGPSSQVAFSSSGTNWKVEMAIAWTELNSMLGNSPGIVAGAPGKNSVWGAQFARLHRGTQNNFSTASKWQPTSGSFKTRPFGTLTFKGGPVASAPDLSSKIRLYNTGFEAPAFPPDSNADTREGWSTPTPAAFRTTSSIALNGTQALMGSVDSVTDTWIVSPLQTGRSLNTPSYIQYAVHLPGEAWNWPLDNYRHRLRLNGDYTTGTDSAAEIRFVGNPSWSGSNIIQVYSYDSPTDESLATIVNFAGLQTFDTWSYVTVRVSPLSRKFEVWYNENKLVRPDGKPFTVRKSSIFIGASSTFLYSKNYGAAPVFFDEFSQYEDDLRAGAADWQLFE